MGDLVKLAKVGDVSPGEAKVFEVKGKPIALVNVNGEYYAIDDVCTHDSGPLADGEVIGYEIECPRHGARFDIRSGKPLCLPAVVPVATYKVILNENDILVEI